MNLDNPTPLRIGMTGSFAGRRYRIDGRLVLSMQADGQTWTWNEFHLVSTDGTTATLVCEDGEEGPEWRLFTLVEPESPITASEAARIRVGDTVRITGQPANVTLVDESRVEFVEGQAPEGVELGDVARYFNAETETEMIVVSWTGDEVEVFRGMTIPTGAVAAGFRIPALAPRPAGGGAIPGGIPGAGLPGSPARWIRPVASLLVLALGASFALRTCQGRRVRSAAIARSLAPDTQLTVGASGTLDGRRYTIAGHALVQVAQVDKVAERHEYILLDDARKAHLLVCGVAPATNAWHLCSPIEPGDAPTPLQAGALRVGDPVRIDGAPATVMELFQCTVRSTDLKPPLQPMGTVAYGFTARSGMHWTMARWDATALRLHRGLPFAASEVKAAFSGKPGP